MKKLLILLCAVALVITACQKEPSHEDPSRTPGGAGETKLVRLVTHEGDDSVTLDYTYNGFDRVTRLVATGIADSEPVAFEFIINRDAANIITSTVLKSPFFVPSGYETDSLVTKYQYDKNTGRYIRAVSHYILDDEAQSDSAVFNYDGTGNLTSMASYFGDIFGYEPDSKEEYTYAGNNLASVKLYGFDGNGLSLVTTETYEYDSKVNPQQSVADAPVLGMLDFYNANNPTKRTTIDQQQAGETYVTTVTYNYNAYNQPTVAVGTNGTASSTVNYYYQ